MPLAVDLGSCNIRIHAGGGRLLREPALVAVDTDDQKVLAVGLSAFRMVGRSAPHIVQLRPVRDGVIANHDLTTAMLRHFIRRLLGWRRFARPLTVLTVSPRSNAVERRALREAAMKAGARDPVLVEAPIAAALGAGLDVQGPEGNLVVHVGSGGTDVAVVCMGEMVVYASCAVGGETLDRAIVHHLERTCEVAVDPLMAERLKIHLGGAGDVEPALPQVDIMARSSANGLPRSITVTASQVREALDPPLAELAECVQGVVEGLSPELAADVAERGAVLTGGGAQLHGLDRYLSESLGIPARVADESASCVVMGATRARAFYRGRPGARASAPSRGGVS